MKGYKGAKEIQKIKNGRNYNKLDKWKEREKGT
jgi:hypothetical protein